jgi:hypothetical protein
MTRRSPLDDFEHRLLNLINQGPDIAPSLTATLSPFNILLQIKQFNASWIFKVRKQSIIVNHRDLVFSSVVIHHSISFESYDELVSVVESSDPQGTIESLTHSLTQSQSQLQPLSHCEYSGDLSVIISVLHLLTHMSTRSTVIPSPISSPIKPSRPLERKERISSDGPISTPTPTPTSTSTSSSRKTKCLKSGWLFKKRDVMSGWTHRYFKVYSGRVEYFVDESAVVPRGVIPLLGADIVGSQANEEPTRVTVNGKQDHFQLV